MAGQIGIKVLKIEDDNVTFDVSIEGLAVINYALCQYLRHVHTKLTHEELNEETRKRYEQIRIEIDSMIDVTNEIVNNHIEPL